MSEARYILKTIVLSKSDAEKFRKQEIEVATAAVRNLYSEASDAARKLKELIDSPLRTERTDYVRIGPGHPDWDKAEHEMTTGQMAYDILHGFKVDETSKELLI